MVGLAAEGQNFDGNGTYVRFQTGGGSNTVSLGQGNLGSQPQFGALPTPPLGNRPAYPGRKPPFKTSQPCFKQQLPDLNGPAAALVRAAAEPERAGHGGAHAAALASCSPFADGEGGGGR